MQRFRSRAVSGGPWHRKCSKKRERKQRRTIRGLQGPGATKENVSQHYGRKKMLLFFLGLCEFVAVFVDVCSPGGRIFLRKVPGANPVCKTKEIIEKYMLFSLLFLGVLLVIR